MPDKSLRTNSTARHIDSFLTQLASAPPVKRNSTQSRLMFAMDATASREHTWHLARKLQSDMFVQASLIGGLDIQLVYFRGYAECKSSPWVAQADTLHRFMSSVRCEAGATQIERVLKHALQATQKKPVNAVVYVGDCIEENIDRLGKLAGELRLLNAPLFIFQEGRDPVASSGFAQLAKVSGGVHCQFDSSSAGQLGQLLNAAALYATGGKQALQQFSLSQNSPIQALLKQLK